MSRFQQGIRGTQRDLPGRSLGKRDFWGAFCPVRSNARSTVTPPPQGCCLNKEGERGSSWASEKVQRKVWDSQLGPRLDFPPSHPPFLSLPPSSLCREGKKTMGRLVFVSFGLLVVFLSLSGTGADFDCPSDWYAYDQHCYRIFNERMTWDDAEWFCTKQAKGGHLVSVKSAGEADFVAWMVTQNIQKPFYYVWIGLRVQNKEKQCNSKWSDGSSVSYDNLMDLYITKCSGLKKGTGFRKWFVVRCIEKNPFVCKFPPQC